MKITLLNTSILTAYGEYKYGPLTLEEARAIVKTAISVQSAIGHESTAKILTDLLDHPVEQNRFEYSQQPGETAIVFKLRGRPPEGKILTRGEIEDIGYEIAVLTRIS